MSETRAPFRIGVNYWPADVGLDWWTAFDPAVVARDFARIAAAGLDSVRVFCTWESFQPEAGRVDTTALAHLITVADHAAAAGLALMPTLFTGHMSGVNLLPQWALGADDPAPRFRVLSGGRVVTRATRNWFDDAEIVAAQTRLAHATAGALAGHPGLWAWDLGNENSNCSQPASHALGREWLLRVTAAIRDAAPTATITAGLHMEDLEEDRRLGPAEVAETCDFLTMHGYPIYAPWAQGPTDERLLGFLTAITRWLGGGTDVLFAEFGLPTVPIAGGAPGSAMLVDEHDAAAYVDRAIGELHATGATGALLWCANDYASDRWTVPPFDDAPHERHFGIWRADGTPKPVVAVLRAHAGHAVATPAAPPSWIDIEPASFFTTEGSHLARLYARMLAA